MRFSTAGLLALVFVAGCGQSADPGQSSNERVRIFGVTVQTMNNPFFIDLEQGLKSVIEAHGDRLVTLDAQYNSLKQKNDISDLLQQQPTAVFINPVNWEGVRGSLIEARRKKVPVIIVDAPVSDPDMVLCQVASDNVEAGRLAAEALAKVNPKARVVILHNSINKACIDRVDGFRQAMSKYPGMTILDTQECNGTIETGRPVTRDLLGRLPQTSMPFSLSTIRAHSGPSRPSSRLASSARSPSSRWTARARPSAVIKAGKLHSSSAQFPREIGKTAAEKMYQYLSGKPVPNEITIPVKLITRENADEFLKSH